jgi:putative ABC transport system ATP-binding protein
MHMAASQAGPAVRLTGVARHHRIDGGEPVRALDGVTLDIATGSTVAVTGPSGSGKSTLLHLIAALDRPDAGTVEVGGIDLAALSRRKLAAHRRRVGFVFQRFNLLPALTALDNVLAPVLPYRVDFDREARARELLDAVGLAGRERSLPSRLSGGQQQRVAVARALINRPGVILADEPTGNLDSRTGAEIVELLLGLRDRDGITVVLATHDTGMAARCDRMVRLVDGRVAEHLDLRAAADPAATLGRLSR